jgi:hypothetical protein
MYIAIETSKIGVEVTHTLIFKHKATFFCFSRNYNSYFASNLILPSHKLFCFLNPESLAGVMSCVEDVVVSVSSDMVRNLSRRADQTL